MVNDRIQQIKWYYAEYINKIRTKNSIDYAIEVTLKNLLIDMRYLYGNRN